MVQVKDKATRRANYEASLGKVPGNYKSGIQRTTNWKDSSLKGQALYEARMQDTSVLRRRANAIERVNEQDWQNAAATKGASRIAEGMRAAAGKQADNYEPIAEALRAVELPSRTADPMANIDNRVKPIVAASIQASPKNRR